jgi:hypothetical protein
MRSLKLASILLVIVSASNDYGQIVGTLQNSRPKGLRYENGLLLSWDAVSTDAKAKQVEILDKVGHSMMSLSVLRLVPEAERVGIWDVSARAGQLIAVSAVFRKADHHLRPVPTLLLFDCLLQALALEPSREILRLTLDDRSNIWTVTSHLDNKSPSTVPMVVEYSPTGEIVKEMLMRDQFPLHAEVTKETRLTGSAFMGFDFGFIWFWLPGSTELVTISQRDSTYTIAKTGLPKLEGADSSIPVRIARETPETLVAQVRGDGRNAHSNLYEYTWSANQGWLPSKPLGPCAGGVLVGATETGLLYLHASDASGQDGICRFDH